MAAERSIGTAEKTGFIEKTAGFMHKNRGKMIVGLAVVAVVVVGMVVYAEIRKSAVEKSTILVEEVETIFHDYLSLDKENSEARQAKDAELASAADTVLRRYPRTYAAARTLFILGDLAFQKKEWEKAAETWTGMAEKSPRSHLAPIALLNAAAAWEENGAPEKALQSLEKILAGYRASFPEIPRVLFSLGRLSEKTGAREKAAAYYNQLIDGYPGGSWANLARSRVIALQVKERTKK